MEMMRQRTSGWFRTEIKVVSLMRNSICDFIWSARRKKKCFNLESVMIIA